MSAGGRRGDVSFRYASALTDYLRDPSERSLRVAYELGREAVGRQLSMLDLAVVQQEALLSALADASGSKETQRVTRAAGDFFLESLASFEMVQRGFREATEAARLERRQTEMSRQLSTFLADASLALDASNRSRRCYGWWPSRHGSSWAPSAALRRSRWTASRAPPKPPPSTRRIGVGPAS